jgi:hypothetical protein
MDMSCDYCGNVGVNYNRTGHIFCSAQCMNRFNQYIELNRVHMASPTYTNVPYAPPKNSQIQIPYWHYAQPLVLPGLRCGHCNAAGDILRYKQMECVQAQTDFCRGKQCKNEYLTELIAARARYCFWNVFDWNHSNADIIKTMKEHGWVFYMLD